MFCCIICSDTLNSPLDLLRHIKLFHCFDRIAEYKCLEPDCHRTYNSFDSFSKHTKGHINVSFQQL